MNIHLLIASRRRVAWLLVALFSVLLLGCNRSAPAPEAAVTAPPTVAAEVTPPAATSTIYTCPMHPHIQQHGPGQCPICGMNLEKREVPTATPGGDAPAPNNAEGTPPTGSADDRRVLYYYDPMRPDVHFDAAGKSPFMDMQLVPKYAEDAPGSAGVAVSAAVIQSLGIRTATPVRRDVRPRIRVPARVVADARGQARLQARVDGWIERLVVRAAGQTVAAGGMEMKLLQGPGFLAHLQPAGIGQAHARRVAVVGNPQRRATVVKLQWRQFGPHRRDDVDRRLPQPLLAQGGFRAGRTGRDEQRPAQADAPADVVRHITQFRA